MYQATLSKHGEHIYRIDLPAYEIVGIFDFGDLNDDFLDIDLASVSLRSPLTIGQHTVALHWNPRPTLDSDAYVVLGDLTSSESSKSQLVSFEIASILDRSGVDVQVPEFKSQISLELVLGELLGLI